MPAMKYQTFSRWQVHGYRCGSLMGLPPPRPYRYPHGFNLQPTAGHATPYLVWGPSPPIV